MRDDETVDRLVEWAIGRDDVHAEILTSTRAIPGAPVDAYSDYDVVLVLEDVASMAESHDWLAHFGEVLISYWDPVQQDPETGAVWVGSVNNYANGLKIDFGLWSRQRFIDITTGPEPHPEFDAGHLVPILEWRIECDHDWSLKTGNLGKGLKKHLPAATWAELADTITGPDPQQNWDALFTMVALFGRTAQEVAVSLGYTYPAELVRRVTEHARAMQQGRYADGPRSTAP